MTDHPGLMGRILKIVAGTTAVLSLIFGIRQGLIYIGDMRARDQRVGELLSMAELQRQSRDYRAAWTSLGEAALLHAKNDSVRRARENLAMKWLENASGSQGMTLAGIGDSAATVLTRGAITASGQRRADLLAHLGWAEFLRWRDRERQLDPAARYRQALDADPQNVYAHTMLGHWALWSRRDSASLAEANRHFAAALQSGRERPYVRGMTFAALRNASNEAADLEILRLTNEMRLAKEVLEPEDRDRVWGVYNRVLRFNTRELVAPQLGEVITAQDAALTFRWLYETSEQAKSNSAMYMIQLARLHEAANDSATALATFQTARREAVGSARYYLAVIDTAIARLSHRR